MRRPGLLTLARTVILAAFLAFTLLPIAWIAKTALTPTALLYSEGVRAWPSRSTFEHVWQIWRWEAFRGYFLNSLVVAGSAAAIATGLAVLAGYALSRWSFAGKSALTFMLLFTQMFSIVLVIVPLMKVMAVLGLLDSLLGLSLTSAAINLPFAIFLMRSFFDTIPTDLDDAATMDGLGRMEAFVVTLLPLVRPGIGTTLGFVFVEAWSELFLALTLLNSESEKTLPAGLLALVTKLGVDWGQVSAAGLVALVPAGLFFAMIQRFLVTGLATGAVKG